MAEHNWTEKTQDLWLPRLKGNSLPRALFWIAHPVTEDPGRFHRTQLYKLTIKIHKNHIPWTQKVTGRFLKLGFWLRTSWGCFLQMQIPRHFPGLLNKHLFLWGPSVASFSKISRGSYLFNNNELSCSWKISTTTLMSHIDYKNAFCLVQKH